MPRFKNNKKPKTPLARKGEKKITKFPKNQLQRKSFTKGTIYLQILMFFPQRCLQLTLKICSRI